MLNLVPALYSIHLQDTTTKYMQQGPEKVPIVNGTRSIKEIVFLVEVCPYQIGPFVIGFPCLRDGIY